MLKVTVSKNTLKKCNKYGVLAFLWGYNTQIP